LGGKASDVTDSIVQKRLATPTWTGSPLASATAQNAFVQGIGCPEIPSNFGRKLVEIEDPVWFVVAGDNGVSNLFQSAINFVYPDMCQMGCLCEMDYTWAFENCPWSQDCRGTTEQRRDDEWRRSKARHLGGVNLGFADGHAGWLNSQSLLSELPKWPSQNAYENWWPTPNLVEGEIKGIKMVWWPTTTPSGEDWSTECGAPPLY
jgi:prepilin-type processing-associated H-X9-DG protein